MLFLLLLKVSFQSNGEFNIDTMEVKFQTFDGIFGTSEVVKSQCYYISILKFEDLFQLCSSEEFNVLHYSNCNTFLHSNYTYYYWYIFYIFF